MTLLTLFTDPAAVTNDTDLFGFEVNSRGELQMLDAFLTATFTTPDAIADSSNTRRIRRRPVYVSAIVDAYQIWNGATFAQMTWPLNHPAEKRDSLEGPTWKTPDDEQGVRLSVSIQTTDDGLTWSAWKRFRPGVLRVVGCRFRITCTRDSTDHNCRIRGFRTEVAALPTTLFDKTRTSLLTEKGILIR